MQEIFQETEQQMKRAVDHFHSQLKQVRTGRASISILEGVLVDYFGTPTPINQVANLSVADATLLVAQPWDASNIPLIEKAIMTSDLGLNPSSDGKVIRIPVPPLTEERRKEFVRKGHDMAEASRTGIRAARRDGNEMLKMMEKEKEISQDDERRGLAEIQRLHDHYIAQVQTAMTSKEKDILEV